MIDTLIILQARFSSSRLPGKVLKTLLDKPMLAHQIARLEKVRHKHKLIVATSVQQSDDAIEDLCKNLNITCFRGSLDDVLDRYYQAAVKYNNKNTIKNIVRITGDCPLIEYSIIDQVIELFLITNVDYCSNCDPATLPDGLDVEVFSFSALKIAWEKANKPSEREHVTPYIRNNSNIFSATNFYYKPNLSHLRWTVDEPCDFDFVTKIYQALYESNPYFRLDDILSLLKKQPELNLINQGVIRNEGLIKSEKLDAYPNVGISND